MSPPLLKMSMFTIIDSTSAFPEQTMIMHQHFFLTQVSAAELRHHNAADYILPHRLQTVSVCVLFVLLPIIKANTMTLLSW